MLVSRFYFLAAQLIMAIFLSGEAIPDGTDERVFIDIFAQRNWLHIREMSNLYDSIYGSIESAIVSEFVGDIENSLVAMGKKLPF